LFGFGERARTPAPPALATPVPRAPDQSVRNF
jgi:hypothetical protein